MHARLLLAAVSCLTTVTPALAHPGDHSFIRTTADAIWHLLEPDHIVFAIVTVIVGIAAYRAGRHAEARVHVTKERRP
jgi:hydrogenase/urease accessory protein HupE